MNVCVLRNINVSVLKNILRSYFDIKQFPHSMIVLLQFFSLSHVDEIQNLLEYIHVFVCLVILCLIV